MKKNSMVGVVFSQEERAKLKREAARKGFSYASRANESMVVRLAVTEYFENHKKEIEGDKK